VDQHGISAPSPDEQPESVEIELTIDGMPFKVGETTMSGSALRHLTHPPISADRDLWIETEQGSDRLIADSQRLELVDGMRLFTVPTQISMGHAR
jgi:hypothetical protein